MKQEIIQGDCVAEMRKFPVETFDLVLTSPPYDNLRDYNGYFFDFENTAREIYRVLKDGGVCVWVVADATVNGSETGTSFKQALFFKEIGMNIHDTMIWEKETFTATGSLAVRYAPVFEYMFVLSKGKPKTFNPIKDKKNRHAGDTFYGTVREANGGTRKQTGSGVKKVAEYGQRHNVWHLSPERSSKNRLHPAPFPIRLALDHVLSWSNEGDTVLDPFLGSGTTLIACQKANRNGVGIEISPEYCEIARQRLSQESLFNLALHNK